ncbi:hypothetical protein MCC10010_1447 [Bifidobacterium longum subsp. longum]|nr:hypothetical protein MCC10006_1491 [Bifidobacterium longum subsp. longum]TCD87443.1 hypothetical protein MCC10010_1447 [Bifidobacterium longum subsp. longum]
MLIPSPSIVVVSKKSSLSRRVNANSQLVFGAHSRAAKLIKKGEC